MNHLETIRITPFGVSVGRLVRHPSVSAFALTLGHSWLLLDCGEGTHHRVLDSRLRLPRLEAVLLSSLQGDHVLGLPGLIATLGSQRRQAPLAIYGPAGANELLSTILRVTGARPSFPLEINELHPGIVRKADAYAVSCRPLPSRGPAFGFRINAGGREIGYCADSQPSEAATEIARGADLLIHEATFAEKAAATARSEERGQTTAAQAARVAREAGARRLLLAYFSPRYSSMNPLIAEAREIFPSAEIARDLVSVDFSVASQPVHKSASL